MIRCPVLNRNCSDIEKYSGESGHRMQKVSTFANNRKVLANYLEQLKENKGWWYRLPEYEIDKGEAALQESIIESDKVLPHFGSLFGLTEAASAIILIEMGCLKVDKAKKKTIIVNQGWEDLANEFKIKKKLNAHHQG